MAGTSTSRPNLFLLIVLLFAQLVLMGLSARRSGGSSTLESWSLTASSPAVAVTEWVGGGISGVVQGIGDRLTAHRRNRMLEEEVRQLRTQVSTTREAALENQRLRRLLGMRETLAPNSIGASVTSAVRTGSSTCS